MAKLKREADKKVVKKSEGSWIKRHRAERITMLFILGFMISVLIWNRGIQDKYQHYNNTNITYEKGIVTEVKNDGLTVDETDSGLDIDALRIVANGVNQLRTPENAAIVITHYQRLLDYIKPDVVHVLYDGRIVKTAGKELVAELEGKGYDWIKKEMGDE